MINKDTLMSIKLTEIINVLNYFVNHLKSLEDLDFSETPTFASGIVAQVFLRTSFLLSFDDDSVKEKIIKMYGMEEIKDKEIWDVQNPAEIIGTALNSYNLDRELPITITLNL